MNDEDSHGRSPLLGATGEPPSGQARRNEHSEEPERAGGETKGKHLVKPLGAQDRANMLKEANTTNACDERCEEAECEPHCVGLTFELTCGRQAA